MSSNEISHEGGKAIIQALAYNESLVDLNLSSFEGLNRNTLGCKGVEPLRQILAFNRFLTILNVSGNFIGNKGLAFICEGLLAGPNQTLLKLNIAQNDINASGMDHLYETLCLTSIKELNVSRNPLKNAGIKKLGDMLSKGGLHIEVLFV